MIKSTIPVINQEIKNGKLVTSESELEVCIDTSVYAQMRWEQNFPKEAEKYDLFTLIDALKKVEKYNTIQLIQLLKTVYCFIDTGKSWLDFTKLFVFNDKEYTDKLIAKISEIFDIVLNGSSEKNS